MSKRTPSHKREESIAKLLDLLGNTQNLDQRFNVGYAHHSLPRSSGWIRAFELRQAEFVSNNAVTIIETIPIKKGKTEEEQKELLKKAEELVGKTFIYNRPIFPNTRSLTQWHENFYQESPAINARARDDLIKIGEKAFSIAPIQGFQFGGKDRVPEVDE